MSRKVTYQLTLEIDVEVEDEIPQEMNFGTFVEDGTLSIYANHGEDTLMGCIQLQNRCIHVDASEDEEPEEENLFTSLEFEWEVEYANGNRAAHKRSWSIDKGETWEELLTLFKENFRDMLRADAEVDNASVGALTVFNMQAYTHNLQGDDYKDGDEVLKFYYDGKEVFPKV